MFLEIKLIKQLKDFIEKIYNSNAKEMMNTN